MIIVSTKTALIPPNALLYRVSGYDPSDVLVSDVASALVMLKKPPSISLGTSRSSPVFSPLVC